VSTDLDSRIERLRNAAEQCEKGGFTFIPVGYRDLQALVQAYDSLKRLETSAFGPWTCGLCGQPMPLADGFVCQKCGEELDKKS
jgi:hypothetical protein